MAAKNYENIIETIGNLSVLELAELVKELETKFGVSAASFAMPAAAAPAAATGSAAGAKTEEKTEFKVTLEASGDKKIDVIKALRKVTPLSLTDAKNMVENTPAVIAEAASKDDAQKIKEALEASGAKVKLS